MQLVGVVALIVLVSKIGGYNNAVLSTTINDVPNYVKNSAPNDILPQVDSASSVNSRIKRKVIAPTHYKWPTKAEGGIPYTLNANLQASTIAVISKVIQFYNDRTCLQFVLNGAGVNKIHFTNSTTGCQSFGIGMMGSGSQDISIGGCQDSFKSISHEVGHALGFFHEQQRSDRDQAIIINYSNAKYSTAFPKNSPVEDNNYNVPYDYGSVMHYPANYVAKNFSIPTMLAVDPRYQQTVGSNQRGPSFFDILAINRRYGCDTVCALSTTACVNGGYPNPSNCSQCVCPLGFAGTLCDQLPPAINFVCGAVYTATTTWQSFSTTAGNTSIFDPASTCYWHIKSPIGTAIEVNLTITNAPCGMGCPFGSVNIGVDADLRKTPICHCCVADTPTTPYVSLNNIVPITAFVYFPITFKIDYRYVPAAGLTTQAYTVTTAAPGSCASGELWYPPYLACIPVCANVAMATNSWLAISYGIVGQTNCYISIDSPPGTQVQLNFTNLNATCNVNCTDSSLAVSDNFQPFSVAFCCQSDIPKSYTMTSNKSIIAMHLLQGFISFIAQYRYIIGPSTTTSTTQITTTTTKPTTTASTTTMTPTTTTNTPSTTTANLAPCPTGQVRDWKTNLCIYSCMPTLNATSIWDYRSAGFSGNYAYQCYWLINSPIGTQVQLNISSINYGTCNAGCTQFSLEVSDNYQPTSNLYCCTTDAPKFTMTSNVAFVIFRSTSTQTAGFGFNAYFRYIGGPTTTTTTVATTTANLAPCPTGQVRDWKTNLCIYSCMPTLNAASTWDYRSAGFSGNYAYQCYWLINSPVGTQVQLNISSINYGTCDAGCTQFSLEVSDNYQPTSNLYCCTTDAPKFTMTSNVAFVIFRSTSTQTAGFGFNAYFRYIGGPAG